MYTANIGTFTFENVPFGTDIKASFIAHKAFQENLTLRDAAISSDYISAEHFDTIVVAANMVGDPDKDLSSLSNS
jgi:fumarate hydratase class II